MIEVSSEIEDLVIIWIKDFGLKIPAFPRVIML